MTPLGGEATVARCPTNSFASSVSAQRSLRLGGAATVPLLFHELSVRQTWRRSAIAASAKRRSPGALTSSFASNDSAQRSLRLGVRQP